MRIAGRRLSLLVAVAALALAGCGGSSDEPEASAGPTASASAEESTPESTPDDSASESADDESSPEQTEDDAVEIEVELEDGQVTPAGDRVDVQVGQTVEFKVDSDADDEMHVHSTPEQAFPVRAGMDDKIYRFRVTRPGVIEVELHEQGDVVVTLAARP
jgi:plastocyanin